MNNELTFDNPYESTPPAELLRTTIEIDRKAHGRLYRCRSKKGTLQTTLNILLDRLIQQLDKHGINEYDPERYEHAVSNLSINLGVRGAASNPPAETSHRDVGHGTVPLAREATGTSLESSDASGSFTVPVTQKGKVKRANGKRSGQATAGV